jgi:D-3-phosphoglycerate dehydrogenase / 2-oxoglutarate reductase
MSDLNPLSFPKEQIKVLLLEGIHESAVKEFNNSGFFSIDTAKNAYTEDELIEVISEYHVLGIRSKTYITPKVLDKATKLMSIGCFCIGTNQVDLDYATTKGVTVFNSPYSNTRSVAELVIAESIMLLRRIPAKNIGAHQGDWQKDAKDSFEARGKVLGIVGYGHIGSQVSVLAESMGFRVLFYDIEPKLPLGNAIHCAKLDELLAKSDVVTLHVPETPSTQNMMREEQFAQMKKGAIFINLSRGTVVDIDALVNALDSGHVSGAAVDVFPEEPESKGIGFKSPLQGNYNVILTPHIGGSTIEAQYNIGIEVAQKLVNLIDNGSTNGSHTVPSLSLPVQVGTHRILHIHKNMPGIMSEINRILSDLDINILGQYLKTNEKIGYVVLDIDKNNSEAVLQKMRQVKYTIKTRILY